MSKKITVEKPRQSQAFAYYLELGTTKRSLQKVSKKFGVSDVTISKWSKKFNWHDRVAIADQKISEKTEAKAIKMICEDVDRLNEIKSGILRKIEKDIKTIEDWEGIADPTKLKAFYDMVKTELGEPSSISSNNLKGDENSNPIVNLLAIFLNKK